MFHDNQDEFRIQTIRQKINKFGNSCTEIAVFPVSRARVTSVELLGYALPLSTRGEGGIGVQGDKLLAGVLVVDSIHQHQGETGFHVQDI